MKLEELSQKIESYKDDALSRYDQKESDFKEKTQVLSYGCRELLTDEMIAALSQDSKLSKLLDIQPENTSETIQSEQTTIEELQKEEISIDTNQNDEQLIDQKTDENTTVHQENHEELQTTTLSRNKKKRSIISRIISFLLRKEL